MLRVFRLRLFGWGHFQRRLDRSVPRYSVEVYGQTRSLATPAGVAGAQTSAHLSVLQATVARFAREQIAPAIFSREQQGCIEPSLWRALFEQGLMGMEIPSDFGGSGLSFVETCASIEQLSKVDPAVALVVDIQNTLLNRAVLHFGTREQQALWLPRLARDTVGSFALSEPEAGSDAFSLRTHADLEQATSTTSRRYVISGSKLWISSAAEAQWMLVFATVDPAQKHRGITAFVIDNVDEAKALGQLEIGPKEDKLGIRATSCCPVHFHRCVIDADRQVLGGLGQGYRVAMRALNEGRIGIAAQMIGLAQGALDATLPYLETRRQFSRPLIDNQGLQFQIAQAAAELEAVRALTFQAARLVDEHQGTSAAAHLAEIARQAASAKLLAAQTACRLTRRCIEWMGGMGFIRQTLPEKFYRDAVIGKIYEGTENMQLATIFRFLSATHHTRHDS
jgi:short/branched chain acyl-CoA dehydrogenase